MAQSKALKENGMKIDIKLAISVVVVILGVVIWGVRLEGRVDKAMDHNERIVVLENLVTELVIEHKVAEILDKRGTISIRRKKVDGYNSAVNEAREWTNEQIPQSSNGE